MSAGGKIDCYLDFNSPYSYFAITWLRKNRPALAEHGVKIDIHPFFLGGVNNGSGNKPPWTLPAKAKYGTFDGARARKYFGTIELKAPPFFPILTILPLRCLLYVKDNFDNKRFEDQFEEMWYAYWRDQQDVSKSDILIEAFKRHFSEDEARKIVEAGSSPKYKKMLTDETNKQVENGAFGAPWFMVRDSSGKVEPFFGSDRFTYMLQYLNVPFSDIKIQTAKDSKL